MKIFITRQAAAQIDEIDRWWSENRSHPEVFREELRRTFESLEAAPEQGPVYQPRAQLGYRRVLLRKSQHYVYYTFDRSRSRVRILAVWSCYRGGPPPLPARR